MKRIFLLFLLILSIASFGGCISYFDTIYGVGLGYGQDGWDFWIGYPYIGTSFNFDWEFLGISVEGGVDLYSRKRSWGIAKLYFDLNTFKIDEGVEFGYDETNIASTETLPIVGEVSFVLSTELNSWKNFGVKAGFRYPFLVYKYITEVEKSFIPPTASIASLPFDIFLGVDIGAAFFKAEFLYFVRYSTTPGYPSPLLNMNNIQVSIKLYQ